MSAEPGEEGRATSARCPSTASISSATRSASRAPPQAVSTIARSSRRLRREDAGRVDEDDLRAGRTMAMPRTSDRVVCTLWLTIETLDPTSRLTSVDLPALGAPMMATKPQRVSACIRRHRPSAFHTPCADENGGGGLCSASRRVRPSPRLGVERLDRYLDVEARGMVGPAAADDRVDRRGNAPALRPFLERGLGVAERAVPGRACVRSQSLGDEAPRASMPAVEMERADHRLADVAEDRRLASGRRTAPRRRRVGSPRRGRAPAPPRRRSRCGPAPSGAAPARPRWPWGRLRSAFPRRPGRAPGRRGIPGADSSALAAELAALAWVSAVSEQRAIGEADGRCGARAPRPRRRRRPSYERLEQPVPADRPWPLPEFPGAGTVIDREEDDLGPADEVFEGHIADRARARGCRSSCRGCRPS